MINHTYLSEINKILATFVTHVQIENANGRFDLNKSAESFLIPIFNQIFKAKFRRLEELKMNFPAIDIADNEKGIAIQITAETGIFKIRETLSKYVKEQLYNTYPTLYILFINSNYKTNKKDDEILNFIFKEFRKNGINPSPELHFSVKTNLLNISTLVSLIERECDVYQLEKIRDHIVVQYGEGRTTQNIDKILTPYQGAFKKELNIKNENLPTQFHSQFFGRESDFLELEDFLKSDDHNIFILTADGGYGKTRLIIELFNKYDKQKGEYKAFLLKPNMFDYVELTTELAEDYKMLILFDDAQDRPEILNDIFGLVKRNNNVKIIITIRKASYNDVIRRVSTHRREFRQHELKRLSYDETQKLFKFHLPGIDELYIKRLAKKSRGVPLVILALCQVTLQGKYDYGLSEDAIFIQVVIEIKNQAIDIVHQKYYIDRQKINKIIETISFFSPINNTPSEIEKISHLNLIDSEETQLIIDSLTEQDFIKKNSQISIIPDPYSDIILLNSAKRLKFLLTKNINIFIDRLITNLIKVEGAKGFDFSFENLLYDFIETFSKVNIDSYKALKQLESRLNTLKSFTYKKPKISFQAVINLITSQLENEEFWKDHEDSYFFEYSFKTVHNNIEKILQIIAINTHKSTDFDSIYDLLILYIKHKPNSEIFNKVFQFTVYDFAEYGYNPPKICGKQQYLLSRIHDRIKNENLSPELIRHVINVCKILLTLNFEDQSYFDKFTGAYSWRNYSVISNTTTKDLRLNTIKLLINIYKEVRDTPETKLILKELVHLLFFIAKPKSDKYLFNQDLEIELLDIFFRELLQNNPLIHERSIITKQLRLLQYREIKEKYIKLREELIDLARSGSTPKEKLYLLLSDQYSWIEKNKKIILSEIANDYSDWNQFYTDLIKIKISAQERLHIPLILQELVTSYPAKARELLELVLNNYPQYIHGFEILIRASYQDEEYFYGIIDKVWSLKQKNTNALVIWMLTYGRNREVNLYKESDLRFVEYCIKDKDIFAVQQMSHTLHGYIDVSPQKTINLISEILKIDDERIDKEYFLQALFDSKELLKSHSEIIKEFIFKETLNIQLGSYYFDNALYFLEDNYGFNCLFDYLKKRIAVMEKERPYYNFSIEKHYNNPRKDTIQNELDFLSVIDWYAEIEKETKHLYFEVLRFLAPEKLDSTEFINGFKKLILEASLNKHLILRLLKALNVYDKKDEYIIGLIVDVLNDLNDDISFNHSEIIEIFGSSFINNTGLKSGPIGLPYSEDIERRDELTMYLKKFQMPDRVKEVLEEALEGVNNSINNAHLRKPNDLW